jgi:cytochrome c-type biogenesis protein CcmF
VILRGLRTTLLWTALFTAFGIALGARSFWTILGVAGASFALVVAVREFHRAALALQRARHSSYPAALLALFKYNRGRYGGYLVHAGVAVMAFAIIGSSFFQQERTVTLKPGSMAEIGRYQVVYQGLGQSAEPGKSITYASLLVRDGNHTYQMAPAKVVFANWESQPISRVVIKTVYPWFEDVYVVMASWGEDGTASFHLFVNPLVPFLWVGGVLLILGGLIAWWPEPSPLAQPVRESRAAVGTVAQS